MRQPGCSVKPGSMPEPVETGETLLAGRVTLAGSGRGLKPTTDTVALAAAVAAGKRDRVLDAGCGSGGAMLCLAARLPMCSVTGLELDPELARLARRNVEANGWSGRIAVREGDIAAWRNEGQPFDIVMTNPPYLDPRVSRAPRDPVRSGAVIETMPLGDWIAHCLRLLGPRGSIVLIHRADRLGDILSALERRTGAVDIMPLLPRADGSPARRILVRATKGSGRPLRILPGLVLHEPDGRYTLEARSVLNDAKALPWP